MKIKFNHEADNTWESIGRSTPDMEKYLEGLALELRERIINNEPPHSERLSGMAEFLLEKKVEPEILLVLATFTFAEIVNEVEQKEAPKEGIPQSVLARCRTMGDLRDAIRTYRELKASLVIPEQKTKLEPKPKKDDKDKS